MPCGYHINNDDGLVSITGKTEVDLDDACDLGHTILNDPDFDPTLPQLVDLRGLALTRTNASTKAFEVFVLSRYRPAVQASMAVVVDDSLDQLSLAGLYHLCSNMAKTELFDNYEQAIKWLMRREFKASPTAAY